MSTTDLESRPTIELQRYTAATLWPGHGRVACRAQQIITLLALSALVACGSETSQPSDAGGCGANSDCDDGVFCNGSERCALGDGGAAVCRPAADPACFPSQTCDENARGCLSACTSEVDADGDGHDAIDCGGDDCDDADPRRFPGNVELCDEEHLDEDCDPETYGARDVDQDGFDDATCCNVESDDTLRCGSDCDDSRPTVHPTAPEACDGLDNDCNGAIDDASLRVYCVDADGDGFGDPARPVSTACPGPDLSALCTDCDDLRSARNPGNPEVCDGVPDNDCDSATNPFDEDGDGYDRASCGGNDCNDLKVSVYPGAPQLCDGYDNTCALGGGVLATEDFDNDGFAPMGAVCSGGPLPALDCNDGSPVVHPLATELCNGIDDNCDGRLDEEPAVSQDCNRPGSVGACVSGACTLLGCTGTFLNCDGLAYNGCEADTLISAAHCGRCDRACASGAACTGGTCACPTGTTTCGDGSGACVDLQTSTANCGDCGHACPAGATCDGGDCNCPFGQILCSGACVDPNVSTDHCGGCGQPCGGGSCTGGRCSCPGGMGAVCDGVCRGPRCRPGELRGMRPRLWGRILCWRGLLVPSRAAHSLRWHVHQYGHRSQPLRRLRRSLWHSRRLPGESLRRRGGDRGEREHLCAPRLGGHRLLPTNWCRHERDARASSFRTGCVQRCGSHGDWAASVCALRQRRSIPRVRCLVERHTHGRRPDSRWRQSHLRRSSGARLVLG
jgi:hypothetical protein